MPNILNLKFKGNKSFVAFSNLNDTESLTKTWKVCTKVASFLEQGQRLENLSWRLWHLQNLIVETDNAKSKREFKKLSKFMGDKLDKEKGRSIEQLEAPDFKHNPSTDKIRQRAVEKERNREASQNAAPGTIKRLQFTFSVDQPAQKTTTTTKKPEPRADIVNNNTTFSTKRNRGCEESDAMAVIDDRKDLKKASLPQRHRKTESSTDSNLPTSLRFPSLFSNDFGPSALLYATPTVTTRMNYGEGVATDTSGDIFSISRPTIELPLEEILYGADSRDESADANSSFGDSDTLHSDDLNSQLSSLAYTPPDSDVVMTDSSTNLETSDSSDDESEADFVLPKKAIAPISHVKDAFIKSAISSKSSGCANGASTPTGRPTLTVRTQAAPTTRSSGPGATATSVNPAVLRQSNNNSAPGGVKAECSNCGATHTPLWRRGLNDELNCNACGLYCKLHKRPRPKSMRNSHGEGRTQTAPRQESVDVMGSLHQPAYQRSSEQALDYKVAQCYNCHTTATPLWRKDDEGKTVCNACGLYYKLHGSARPISMKSDVIRKRSRHDARRASGAGISETPQASPGVSRRASPAREVSPTLAPDSTTQMSYEFNEETDYRSSQSELMGALGQEGNAHNMFGTTLPWGASNFSFPGPYHPDLIAQSYNIAQDPLPFASVDLPDNGKEPVAMSPRQPKRRRMSTDSASEPPSSAVSTFSYDGYSSSASSTSHSQRSAIDFPYGAFPQFILKGPSSTFWHPPMLPQDSPQFIHPPMLPPSEESPMDYLHAPALPQDDDNLFSTYLHPPMTLPEETNSNHGLALPANNESLYANF